MKNIIVLALFSLCFLGCSQKPTKREVITYVFDFREHTKSGFFISPTPYIGLFDPVGEINIRVYPAKTVRNDVSEYEVGVLFGKSRTGTESNTTYITEKITPDELLNILVDEAKALGADGIVNVSIRDETATRASGGKVITEFLYYKLSGFAIKRK